MNLQKQLDIFTVEELEELLQINKQTIRKHVKNKDLKAYKVGKRLYFIKDDIMEWLKRYSA